MVLLTLPALLSVSIVLLALELTRGEQLDSPVAAELSEGLSAQSGAPDPLASELEDVSASAVEEPEATRQPSEKEKPDGKQKPKRKPKPKLGPAPPEAVVTITAVGDIVMGTTGRSGGADGGAAFFGGVDAMLAGDVVLGNLEGTLSTGGGSRCPAKVATTSGEPATTSPAGKAPVERPSRPEPATPCYAFQMPPGHARWLKRAGFTVMNIANNHAWDYGLSGRQQTVQALRDVELAHTGRPGQITIQEAGGVRIAIVGFSPDRWSSDLRDIPAARELVRKAAKRAHVVVVTMHAGAEGPASTHVQPGVEYFLGTNRGDTMRFAHAVVNAGADLVVGHGPHLLRGLEWHKGRLIAYSLGNFGAYDVFNLAGDRKYGGILKVRLSGDGTWAGGKLIPTYLRGKGLPVLDPERNSLRIVRSLSRQDFGSKAVRAVKGALVPPPSTGTAGADASGPA